MNIVLFSLIFLVSIFGLIRSILKKKRININNKWTIISIDSILITTLILIMSYQIIGPDEMIKDIKNLNFDTWVLTISISVLIVVSVFSRYYLLDNFELSKFKPILIALRTIFIVIIGYLLFDEELTKNKIIGCLFILAGIYFISN